MQHIKVRHLTKGLAIFACPSKYLHLFGSCLSKSVTMATSAPLGLSSPNVTISSGADASSLSVPTNEFGLHFMRNFYRTNASENVLFSPLSIILCYNMVLEGAANETERQIIEVLKLSSIGSRSDVSRASKKLLTSYRKIEDGSSDRDLTLSISNLAVLNKLAKLKEAYVRSLMDNYFAQATNEDFENGATIQDKVNSWVANRTHNKITQLLSSPPSRTTILMLLNTLYFKGKWVDPFPKRNTFNGTFNNADGSSSETNMMTMRTKEFNYFHDQNSNSKIIQLPYHGNFSMLIIMGTGPNYVFDYSKSRLNHLIDSMEPTEMDTVSIPRFKFEDEHLLHSILPDMGMDKLFSDSAQLPRISESDAPIKVSKSVHKALLEVDEEGSTAVAVTYIGMTGSSLNVGPTNDFIADRPFLFLIRDDLTNVTLFMGKMNKMANINT